MFSNVEDLKSFLLWAKEQRIESVKAGEVEIKFSSLAFVGSFPELDEPAERPFVLSETAEISPETKKEDEETLFWSSQS
jgi:hypothetical protein